jgi:hypothetical protein
MIEGDYNDEMRNTALNTAAADIAASVDRERIETILRCVEALDAVKIENPRWMLIPRSTYRLLLCLKFNGMKPKAVSRARRRRMRLSYRRKK